MKYIINYENGVFKGIEIGQENCPDICMILIELIKMIYE